MALANAINATSSGYQVLNSSNVFISRSIVNTSNQNAITNQDGTSGSSVISLTSPIYVSGISFDSGTNTLSAFSTGTYSPTISASGTSPTVGYSSQVGRYTRIGNRIICCIYISVSSYTAGTVNLQVVLPFTSVNVTGARDSFSISLQNITFNVLVYYLMGFLQQNNSFFTIRQLFTGIAGSTLQSTDGTATMIIQTTLIYEV